MKPLVNIWRARCALSIFCLMLPMRAAGAEALPFSESFDDCTLTGWTLYRGDADTVNTWKCGGVSSYIEANGFGDSAAADEWLITPLLDLTSGINEVLTFRSQTNYSVEVTEVVRDTSGGADTRIHEIQGSGTVSPLTGHTVVIEGIVVGDFQDGDADDKRNLQGFYVQEEDADADADGATSEGIFVYEAGAATTDVGLGDKVRVSGTVDEFFGETQIDSVTDITLVGAGHPLPVAASVSLPAGATTLSQNGDLQPDLEAYEGMRVTFPDTLSISEMFQLDRFNEIKLTQGGRPDQFTQLRAPSVAGYAAHLADLGARTITYDDGLNKQNAAIGNLDGFGPTFDTETDLRMGDTVTGLSGVLSYQWAGHRASGSTWRVRSAADGDNAFVKVNRRPAAPADVGGTLKVASLNILNYFNGDGSGGGFPTARGAANLTEFQRQTEKLVTALSALNADLIGLMELENDYVDGANSSIASLVDALNAAVGAGTYAYVDPGVNVGGDEIAVGMIYKTATVSPAADATVEILDDGDLAALGMTGPIFSGAAVNRSPLAATFEQIATGARFTVAVTHLKSKGSAGRNSGDADANDGQGYSNATRLLGVEALKKWLDTDPTASGDADFLVIGDFNAYAEEDPITYLEGQGYADLAQTFIGGSAYSFVYDGQKGTLNYAFANPDLLSQVTGAAIWNINADEPDALDYNTDFGRDPTIFDGGVPYRESDHEPVIVGLKLSAEC